jgi:hypothetical protein
MSRDNGKATGKQWDKHGILFGAREHGNNGKTMGKQWDRTWVRTWVTHRYFCPENRVRAMEKQWENNEITIGTLFSSRQHGEGKTMGKQWENNGKTMGHNMTQTWILFSSQTIIKTMWKIWERLYNSGKTMGQNMRLNKVQRWIFLSRQSN